jgi:hypothetical protein
MAQIFRRVSNFAVILRPASTKLTPNEANRFSKATIYSLRGRGREADGIDLE